MILRDLARKVALTPRMGDVARTDDYSDPMTGFSTGGGAQPDPRDPYEGLPMWALQAADRPNNIEPQGTMWPEYPPPEPKAALPEDRPNPLIPFSAYRSLPPQHRVGDLAAQAIVEQIPSMLPGRLGMATTMTMDSDEAQAHKLKIPKIRMGEILAAVAASPGEQFANPKLRAKAEALYKSYPQYAETYPEVGPPALMTKLPDPKNPGKYLIKPGPEVPYGLMEEALAMDAQPGYFLSKKKLPQVEEFADARNTIQQNMDLHGYEPYFDPAKRYDVDPKHYGPFADTGTAAAPATAKTDTEWYAKYGTPENRAKLQAGFAEGKNVPESANWYHMGQLENEYVKELGPEAGRAAFKREFGDMMAATTGGADPYNNFLMSQYANVLAKRGERLATRAYELPAPIGGRYASGNLEQAQKYIDAGMVGFDPAQNPKRYDFSSAFAGNPNAATIDEQMYGALRPPTTKESVGIPEWYGPATRVAREEAAKAGVDARGFQDVAWAGLKKGKTEGGPMGRPFTYEGPMINHINRSIETTHQLTGMPREEIVRRGLIRKEIPMYGIGGAAAMGALADQSRYQTEERN